MAKPLMGSGHAVSVVQAGHILAIKMLLGFVH
jgi:hypothetical protein